MARSMYVVFLVTAAVGRCWGQNFTFTDDACHTKMGECVPEQDCEHPGLAHLPCAAEGTVCCHPSHQARADTLLQLSDIDMRKRDCSNRKCEKWYGGFWVYDPQDCSDKQRLVMGCAEEKKWCCAPPCVTWASCSGQRGYCGPWQRQCYGNRIAEGCRGKQCFCCVPDGSRPPCPCQGNSVNVCSGSTLSLSENQCVSVTSPAYPYPYDNDLTCQLTAVAPQGCTINVNLCDVSLDFCPYDTLTLQGSNLTEPLCGENNPGIAVTTSNAVTMTFSTDGDTVFRGFALALTVSCGVPSCTSALTYDICAVNTITASSGVIQSPNYPNNYSNSLNCQVTINAPSATTINLSFLAINVETQENCLFDDVTILGTKYCGTTAPPDIIVGTNSVTIFFKTDFSVVRTGFRLCFQANQ